MFTPIAAKQIKENDTILFVADLSETFTVTEVNDKGIVLIDADYSGSIEGSKPITRTFAELSKMGEIIKVQLQAITSAGQKGIIKKLSDHKATFNPAKFMVILKVNGQVYASLNGDTFKSTSKTMRGLVRKAKESGEVDFTVKNCRKSKKTEKSIVWSIDRK